LLWKNSRPAFAKPALTGRLIHRVLLQSLLSHTRNDTPGDTTVRNIRVTAPAKINLYLRVLGVRPDGYHEIETLFQAIDLCDELIIRKSGGQTTIEVPGYPDLETEDNLVIRAIRWIENEFREKLPVNILLMKHIPEAAGLGGGSSDGAATLLGIRNLFNLNLTDEDMSRAALSLGADVSFFLKGGTAVGEGVGECLTSVTLKDAYPVLLINPGFRVSTGQVFREFSKGLTGRPREGKLWKLLGLPHKFEDLLHNDLQSVCERLYPETGTVRRALGDLGIKRTLMTGSGPTFFGIADSDQVIRVKERIPPKWKVFFVRPVQRGVAID